MSNLEIERKFLLRNLPSKLDKSRSESIQQGYIALTSDSREVRIRRKGETRYLTVKVGRGLTREETEIEISEYQFDQLWPTTGHAQLQKIRHYCHHGEHLVEIDQYQGMLAPLLVAEVEFDSEAESRNFIPPDWFGEEITNDLRFSNYNLATGGLPNLGKR